MKLTGAQILCESLQREGVEVIFGYPGGAIMPVYDALLEYPKLRHILVRHEQGAVHAAEGYARATGKVGVCLVTSGPGATNLVTGLADAMMDSVPLVCISGQVASHLLGYDAFQEADVMGITSMITKHNHLVLNPEEIASTVKEAFYIAGSGRPGPVMIDITKDAQFNRVEFKYPKKINIPGYNPTVFGNMQQIKKAATLINNCQRPLIIAGHGVLISGAQQELEKLSNKNNIPVAVTLLGISSMLTNHPNYVGMVGMHGNYAPNICTNEADLIIGLGLRFDDRVTSAIETYARKAKIIHIDIDPAEIDKNIKSDVPIVGDVRQVLTKLLPLVKTTDRQSWLKVFANYQSLEFEKVTRNEIAAQSRNLHMGEVVRAISDATEGRALIVSDVGQNQMFSARYYEYKKYNSYFTSGGLGTMGYSLPAGIGAKVGCPKDEVWVIVGDGGLQMTIQEMATIKQENLNIKIALLNNSYLGMVRQWQQLFFSRRYSQVALQNPDFIKLAEGFGIKAVKVTSRKHLKSAVLEARKHNGSVLLEFVIEKEANIFPMIPTGMAVDQVRLE